MSSSNVFPTLPYDDLLEKEDVERVKTLRDGIAQSVSLRDPSKSGLFYSNEIKKHINLKGKLSPDDKSFFVNALQELLYLPESDFNLQSKFSKCLALLLKKSKDCTHLITIPWKPLFQLIWSNHFVVDGDLYRAFLPTKNNGVSLISLAKRARKFFGISSTREILDFFLPELNVYTNQSLISLGFLSTFFFPLDPKLDYRLFLEQMSDVWSWIDKSSSWDFLCISIISRVISHRNEVTRPPASKEIVSKLFTRFLKVANVTLGSSSLPKSQSRNFPKEASIFLHHHHNSSSAAPIAKTIVHLLPFGINQKESESTEETKKNFALFMSTLSSFYHPSNQGHWTDTLGSLMYHLSKGGMKRMLKEGVSEYSHEFSKILLPIIYQGLYSKHKGLIYCSRESVRFFCLSLPNETFESLIPRIHTSFETLQFPHQFLSNLDVLGSIFGELVTKKGKTEMDFDVKRFLYSALGWIDSSLMEKTKAAFKIFYRFFSFVPLAPLPNSFKIEEGSEEEEFNRAKKTFIEEELEDWVLQFMDVIFELYSNQDEDQKDDGWWYYLQETTFRLFFEMQSPQLFQVTCEKLQHHLFSGTFNHAKREFGWILRGCVSANPQETLRRYIPKIHNDLLVENSKGTFKDVSEDELEWKLSLLSHLVVHGGSSLLEFQKELKELIGAVWKTEVYESKDSMEIDSHPSKKSRKNGKEYKKEIVQIGGDLLQSTLQSLSHYYPSRYSPSFQELKSYQWGDTFTKKNLQIEWHVPNSQEVLFAKELFQHFFSFFKSKIVDSDSKFITKESLLNHLELVHSALQGVQSLLPPLPSLSSIDQNDEFNEEKSHFKSVDHSYEIPNDLKLGSKELDEIGNLLLKLLQKLNSEHGEDVSSLQKGIDIVSLYLSNLHGTFGLVSSSHFRIVLNKYKHPLKDRKENSKSLLVEKEYAKHLKRYSNQNGGVRLTDQVKSLLEQLYHISESSYVHVRKSGQSALERCFRKIPFAQNYVYFHFKIPSILKDKNASEAQVKRSIHILNNKFVMEKIVKNWKMLDLFVDGLANSFVQNDTKIQNSIYHLYITFITHFCPSYLHSNHNGNQLSDHFNSIVKTLLQVCQNEKSHWRYSMMTTGFLFAFSPRLRDVAKSIDEFGLNPQLYTQIFNHFVKNMTSELPMIRSISIKGVASLLTNVQSDIENPLHHQMKQVLSETLSDTFINPQFLQRLIGLLSLDHELTAKEAEAMESASASNNLISSIFNRISSGVGGGDQEIATLLLKEILRGSKEFYPTNYVYTQPKSLFNEVNATLWSQICSFLSTQSLEEVLNSTDILIDSEEVEKQVVLAELVGGLLRVINNSTTERSERTQRLWKFLIPILTKVANKRTSSASVEWSASVRFGSFNKSLDEFAPLVNLIFENLFDGMQGKPSVLIIRQLLLLKGVLLDFNSEELNLRVIEKLRDLEIPYKQVSQAVGEIASIVYFNLWNPKVNSSPQKRPELVQFARRVIDNDNSNSMELESYDQTSSILLSWIGYATQSGLSKGSLFYLPEVDLLAIFGLVKDPNEELSKQAIHTLALLSQVLYSWNELEVILASVEKVSSENQNWNVRKTAPPFLQILSFNHRFELRSDQDTKITNLVIAMLFDTQVEVRELAKGAFASIIRGTANQERFIPSFTKLSRTPIGENKDVHLENETTASNSTARHAGILGLSSIVLSNPYDVPDWMPELLSDLSVHINDPMPIKETVRATFAEFWRTHLDEWKATFKEKFTQEQQDNISGTQHTQNYFA